MSYVLGLDFGTSFTAAAAHSGGTTRVITLGNRAGAVPSVLLVRADGSMIFGEEAYLRGASEPGRLVRNLKRRLGDATPVVVDGHSYSPEELVAAFLTWVVTRVSEREGGSPDRIVLTHPANWHSMRLEAFRRAVAQSGVATTSGAAAGSALSLVTEPYAAAVFHGNDHALAVGDAVAAYDLGGGTFDAAVLRRTTVGFEPAAEPEGAEDLGGVDFDDIMFHLVQTKLGPTWTAAERRGGAAFITAAAGLRRECIAAKEALSVDAEVDIPVILPGVSAPVRVSRDEFERMIRSTVAETLGIFRRALGAARLAPSDLSALLLVGGSSRVPLVRSMVADFVGEDVPLLDADPKHAVARGAAMLAADPGSIPPPWVPPDGRAVGGPGPSPAGGAAGVAGLGAAAATGAAVGGAALAGAVAASPAPPTSPYAPPAPTPGAPSPVAGAPIVPPAPAPGAMPPPVPFEPPGPGGPGSVPGRGPGGGAPEGPLPAPAPAAEPAGSRRRPLVAVGVVAALAIAAAAIAFAASRGGDDGGTATAGTAANDHTGHDNTASTGTEAPTTSGVPAAAQPASADRMTAIAAGSYPVGVAAASAEAAAAQTIAVEPYYLDTYEVTNAEYDRFVQSQGAPAPTSWSRTGYATDKAEHPVVGVDWGWAQAYCIALSKRLPREAEWEAAARGPEGLLYPWGASPEAVDLDTPGSKPVGSVAANVSVFGVHDTVGSAWEWVDEPYAPVGPTQRVRRGGENGRVRGGAAMRQAVEVGNESAIAETGFRCAADAVDPATAPGQFSSEHPTPEAAAETTVASTNPAGGAVLVDDTFENPKSGWADKGDGVFKVGYHAPTWYHLDATQAGVQVVSLGGFQYGDVGAEAKVYVDKTGSETGRFRYGLVFRAEGPDRAPPGAKGPNRPEDFYAFVVEPRAGRWELIHEDTLPMRRMLDGALPAGFKGFDSGAPDVLKADMRGSVIVLSINGQQVGAFDTRGYHLSGDVGFYLETFDEQKAHVHFDELNVVALGPA